MKNLIYLLIFAMVVSGCATPSSVRMKNRQSLMKLSIGMSKNQALAIMGTDTFNVYGMVETAINNPYRTEILKEGDKTFEIFFYYTDATKLDGIIMDDELTPLVFDDGRLIGWGWGFLKTNIQKHEIRIR